VQQQTECKRCGKCCQNGGPALHQEDLNLFSEKILTPDNCITIRKNELVSSPSSNSPVKTDQELIKIKGQGNRWNCLFFNNNDNNCTIYISRPMECRLFKCWEPAELQAVIGKNTLSRKDLLADDDPALESITLLEEQCPIEQLHALTPLLSEESNRDEAIKKLEILANKDLQIRMQAIQQFSLSQSQELFLFGRPFFLLRAGRENSDRSLSENVVPIC